MLPTIPTLDQLKTRMLADLDYRLPSLRSRPAKSVLSVLMTVLAGAISSLYAFAGWIAQQLDPLTASPEWLEVWGERFAVPRKLASVSSGSVLIAGSGLIPLGTKLRHPTSQSLYRVVEAGSAGIPVAINSETTGLASNLASGTILILESPISGLEMNAVCVTALTGGADTETLTNWAIRIAERLKERQKIGDADDYRAWAKAAHPSVIDAAVYSNTPELGDISIYVLGSADQPVLPPAVISRIEANLSRLCNVAGNRLVFAVSQDQVRIKIANAKPEHKALITTEIIKLLASKQRFAAKLYPEEIERILVSIDDNLLLLEPISLKIAAQGAILVAGGIEWL